MNKKILLVSYCISALISVSAAGRQVVSEETDTLSVPEILEEPPFSTYRQCYKSRLDSIQKIVPLTYNEYVQNYIDIYSSRKEMMGKMLGLSSYYFPIFAKALRSYDIPEEIKYLPIIESAMNPHAVSRVGATGLWQFMFATAKGYGLTIDRYEDQRKDPIQASYAAAAYFRDAYEELGDWLLAIAAYNCGMGNVKRAMDRSGSADFWVLRKYLPRETRNYVPAYIAAVYVMKCAEKHEIVVEKSGLAEKTDTIQVTRFVSLPDLAAALEMDENALCSLNPCYKKKIVNGTVDLPKRLVVPKISLKDFVSVYEVLNGEEKSSGMNIRLASSGEESKSPRKSYFYHKVSSGQNLSVIAEKYHVEVQDLKVWNHLKGTVIVPGQRLKIYTREAEQAAPSAQQG